MHGSSDGGNAAKRQSGDPAFRLVRVNPDLVSSVTPGTLRRCVGAGLPPCRAAALSGRGHARGGIRMTPWVGQFTHGVERASRAHKDRMASDLAQEAL